MRIYAVVCMFILLVASCTSKEEQPVVIMDEPADLIAQDKMIQIIADVHLLEAALQFRAPRAPSRLPTGISPQEPMNVAPLPTDQKTLPYYDVFAKHGVTRDQYERSLRWYMTDAEQYGLMYDEVINELVRRQAVEQQGTAIQKPDSIR